MKQSEIAIIFCSNIKALRKAQKLNQQHFADLLEVSRSKVGSWEESRAFPNYEMLMKISEVFSLDIHQILTNKNYLSLYKI